MNLLNLETSSTNNYDMREKVLIYFFIQVFYNLFSKFKIRNQIYRNLQKKQMIKLN